MALQTESIAIPVTKGIDVNTEARLVQAPHLLEATNSRFPRAGGATKRRGHTQSAVKGNTLQPANTPTTGLTWFYGKGYRYASLTNTETAITPEFPDNGHLYGVATRDTESLVWNGHLLYSYSPAQLAQSPPYTTQVVSNAVMPSLVASPIAKVQTGQLYPDFADNGVVKLVTWVDSSNVAYYAVYDSVTGAAIVTPRTMTSKGANYTTAYQIRTLYMGHYLHALLCDSATNTLLLLTISQDDPTANFTQRSLGACNSHFDLHKYSETATMVTKSNNPYVDVYWLTNTGEPNPTYPAQSFLPLNGFVFLVGVDTTITVVAGCTSLTNQMVVTFGTVSAGTYAFYADPGATSTGATTLVKATGVSDAPIRIAIAAKAVVGSTGVVADIFWDSNASSVPLLHKQRYHAGTGIIGGELLRYHQSLASQGFTVGDRTFVWTGHNTTLQSTWFLLDEGLDPVGHMDFGIANAPTLTSKSFLAGVNYTGGVTTATSLHLALGFKVRVPATATTTGVFTEPSIKTAVLNFLPKLRSTQGGRCTYFAGAQVWSYDGVELTEAGFHVGPELATPIVSVGGSLSNPGSYSYRVDLCYRNAQNEETRSLSILTTTVATTGANKTITLKIPSCITRRTNSYFLIYRNAVVAGTPLTNWWLLNSRDPSSASFYVNDQTVPYRTVVDDGTVTDTAIQNFELHPATSGDTYLQPVAAPACEVITAGHDRLWVSGGELTPGTIAPSRLFGPGEAASFNPYLNIQVDRGFEPITAIGFTGNIKVFFRANNAYVLDGDGPDNVSNGLWATPQLALADIGAVSQESLALITPGLLFQSYAGIRLMSASGNAAAIGVPVDTLAKTLTVRAAVVANHDQEVRWYCDDQVLVYSYLYDTWSTWSFGSVGAIRLPSGLAAVARSDGNLWVETEGAYTDGPNNYTHRIRFPWLTGGSLGDFQRVRAIQGLGHYSTPHNVHVDIYYDERAFAEESFDWSMPDATSSNVDIWGGQVGSATPWGQGVWGDQLSITGSNAISDQTWEWVRKPNRQKCSVLSVAIDDNNTAGAGFVLTALGLSLAKKPGLNRVPERGGTDNYRGGQ